MSTPIYYPREDSYLIKKHLADYANNTQLVIEIGTGSGILAIEAAQNAKKVIAIDINEEALEIAKAAAKKAGCHNIIFLHSDQFLSLKQEQQADLIVSNPPYLPQDKRYPDVALDGGKKGYEFIQKFLAEASKFLKPEGIILLLFSSLTKKNKVDEFIKKNLLSAKQIDQEKFSFEELYVYEIKKTELLIKLEKLSIKNIHYFTQGNRGVLFKGSLLSLSSKKSPTTIVVKTKNEASKASGRIHNEVTILKQLEQYGFSPKVLLFDETFFSYEYIDGTFILDFIANNSSEIIRKILQRIFEIMFLLDELKITKEEMHHPIKHIIITKNNEVKLLDFERAHKTDHPKNVTQFCQFLINTGTNTLLKEKEIIIDQKKMIKLSKIYRRKMNQVSFKEILNLIKPTP